METFINKAASNIVIGNTRDKNVFIRATEIMKKDESSYRVRFATKRHVTLSICPRDQCEVNISEETGSYSSDHISIGAIEVGSNNSACESKNSGPPIENLPDLIEMEGQGVLIYDHATGQPSHVSISQVTQLMLTSF